MKLITAFLTACLLASSAFSQNTPFFVTPGSDTVAQGQLVCVPVRVQGFNNLATLLIAINWDPQVLTFHHIQAYNLPDMDAGSFANNKPGRLGINWGLNGGGGVTRPNGTAIFEICFTASGINGSCTNLTPNGMGFPGGTNAEAATPSGINLWSDTSGITGHICIQNSVSIPEVTGAHSTVNVYPNPVAERLTVECIGASPQEALRFEVLDASGKTLRSLRLLDEKTEILMNNLPAGAYQWQLQRADRVVQRGTIVRE